MNDICLAFLSLSLSGSLTALFILMLKLAFKNRLSKTWQYYIFLIVVIRLLLPFGPDTSLVGMVFRQIRDYAAAEDNPAAANMDNLLLLQGEAPQAQGGEGTDSEFSAPGKLKNVLTEWLWLAWLAPAVLLLLRRMAGYRRYMYAVKNGYRVIAASRTPDSYQTICEAMNIKRPPKLAHSRQAGSPMLAGIIHPVIVLPDADWNDTDLSYIFWHELTHYKRLDIVYKWLVQIAVCVHWFNPLVYWISRQVSQSCELSCDETVIRQLDVTGRYAYGDMLLGAIRLDKTISGGSLSITLSEDGNLIKKRLEAIMTYKKQRRIPIMLSALLAVFLFCGAAFAGVYKAEPATWGVQTEGEGIAQTIPVTIDQVEMRYYEDENPDGRWPYIHRLVSNHSDKTITDFEIVYLAYDVNGNPLELIWRQLPLTDGLRVTGYTSQSDKSYEQIIESVQPILPGATEDLNGGWSLWDGWNQADNTHDVAYVPACMKQITFEDGTVWDNPEYQSWLTAYKGKHVEPEILATYYDEGS